MASNAVTSSGLYVRTESGRYVVASEDRVVEVARDIAGRRTRRGDAMSEPAIAMQFFQDKLAGLEREIFAASFLDTRHRLIEYQELFQGTIDGAEVHPREVARRALAINAAAVIVAHNHPSGVAEPSAADRAVTCRLKQALALIDVRLLDHIVVAGGSTVSMAGKGLV